MKINHALPLNSFLYSINFECTKFIFARLQFENNRHIFRLQSEAKVHPKKKDNI